LIFYIDTSSEQFTIKKT